MPIAHILLALLVTLIWGLNFVVIKVGLGDFPPLLFCACASPWRRCRCWSCAGRCRRRSDASC